MQGPGSLQHNTYSIGVFTDRHGVARFPWVGLGQQLRATAILDANGNYDWVDFEGPREQAQVTRDDLAPARERREFRACIIDLAGLPLADRWLQAEMRYRSHGEASLQRNYLRTDADGVAHLPAGTGDDDLRADFLNGELRLYLAGPDRTL